MKSILLFRISLETRSMLDKFQSLFIKYVLKAKTSQILDDTDISIRKRIKFGFKRNKITPRVDCFVNVVRPHSAFLVGVKIATKVSREETGFAHFRFAQQNNFDRVLRWALKRVSVHVEIGHCISHLTFETVVCWYVGNFLFSRYTSTTLL